MRGWVGWERNEIFGDRWINGVQFYVTINSARFFDSTHITGIFCCSFEISVYLVSSVIFAGVACLQLDEAEFHGKSEWKNTGAQVNVVLHAD